MCESGYVGGVNMCVYRYVCRCVYVGVGKKGVGGKVCVCVCRCAHE